MFKKKLVTLDIKYYFEKHQQQFKFFKIVNLPFSRKVQTIASKFS